jgi:predicted DNA-binding ribbon-helix-helix protein
MAIYDDMREQIIAQFDANENRYMTVTQLIDRIYSTHSADSNHPYYRKVLTTLNAMQENGLMETRTINRYVATKWRMLRPE